MFARSVTVRLKPNSVAEFNKTFEKEKGVKPRGLRRMAVQASPAGI
jgi:hypothetical protein